MKRLGLSLFVLALAAACSGNGTPPPTDAGTDAGIDGFEEPIIRVSGTAHVHPSAVAWMQAESLTPPELAGLTLRVQEPLRVALNDPDAVFGSVTLGADATFSVDGVDTAKVNTGIAAGVVDERDAGMPVVVRTSTAVWDVQLREGKPEEDITGARALALPREFHDQLTVAVGPATILSITGNQFDRLVDSGFMLGRIVDAQGNPVAGAQISAGSAYDPRIWYPNETFSGSGQSGTSAHGLFVYVHPGTQEPSRFTFQVKDRPEYRKRNGGAAVNGGLLMTVFPGTAAP
jgi:hypothetical protein